MALRIGFDAKRAVSNNTGLGNYSRLVIDVLSEYYPDGEYWLYAPKIKENPRLSELLLRKNVGLHAPATASGRALPSLWRVGRGLVGDFERDGVDIFHGLSNELPLAHTTALIRCSSTYSIRPKEPKNSRISFSSSSENSARS